MSSQTPNLNLVLPVGTEKVSRQIINDNNTKIDTAVGANSTAIAKVQNCLAYIVGETNTTGGTLEVGQFVYVKNHSTIAEGLRTVTASISANGNITTSNTSACSDGGLNTLNSKINNLPNTLNSSYNVLIDTVQISQTETSYTLYGSRKFSDYSILYITPMVESYFRPGCVIPRSSFAGNGNGTSFTYTSGGVNVEVVIRYFSDTQVKMKYNASATRDVRIYLGALKLE